MALIQPVNLTKIDENSFEYRYVSCIILTHDNKILLQKRGRNWSKFPGMISTFGGRIEENEKPKEALIRELNEELGAQVDMNNIIELGAYTEAITEHTELIYGFFWHDRYKTITGCYEGEPIYYDNPNNIPAAPISMDDVLWLVNECKNRHLF